MQWYYYLIIVLVLVGVGVGGYFIYKHFFNKKQNVSGGNVITNPNNEIVQLVAVKRLMGSDRITGFETNKEVKKRLSKLNINDFKELNIIDYPWTREQWEDKKYTGEDINNRNAYEQSMLFAYNADKTLNKENNSFILREFKK